MGYSIPSYVTPHGVVRLLLCNEISLTNENNWSVLQAETVFNTLLSMKISEILSIVDSAKPDYLNTAMIPQFGSIENLIRVPFILASTGCSQLNYAELGLRLKNDINANLTANIKFGENHGKGAALLGLINCEGRRFLQSSLSLGFCQIGERTVQREVVLRLFFRIPLVQAILSAAKKGTINGYELMSELTQSTKKRRGQCLRAIFSDLNSIADAELSKRIQNITWEI